MSNRPTYGEGGQRAASSEPGAAAKPVPRVNFSDEGETLTADQSEETKRRRRRGQASASVVEAGSG